MKFGGTSMGSAERIRAAAAIISEQQKRHSLIVVVSAMSKVTDLLLETLRRAELSDRAEVDSSLDRLLNHHLETCEDLFEESASTVYFREAACEAVQSLVSEFHRIANGILMLGERPPRSVDEALAIGERLSSALLAQYLGSIGVDACAINGSDVIVTDAVFGNASPLIDLTRKKCAERLPPLIERG